MANEVNFSGNLNATKNGASVSASASAVHTMTGTDMEQGTQTIINTDAQALTFGSITGAPEVLLIKNLDATNYIELATDEPMSNKFAKIKAGKFALFPPSSATIYAQANTAAVAVLVVAVEA